MKKKWLALFSVMLAYSFAFLTRYIYSPLMGDMSKSLNMTSTKAGLLMTGFMVGYILMQLPGGLLADRLVVRRILIADMIVSGIATAFLSSVNTFAVALVLRVIIGLACGSIYSCCSKVIAHYFEKKELSVAMGILLATAPAGIMLANSAGEAVAQSQGWRKTFLFTAVISLLAVICLLLFVEDFREENRKSSVEGLLGGIKAFISDKQQIILGMSGFMLMFETVGFAHWTNVYLEEGIGMPGETAGLILTAYSVSGIVFSSLSGTIARKLKANPRRFIIVCEILMLITTVGFAFCRSQAAFITVGILCGAFTYLPSTHYVTLAMARSQPQNIGTTAAFQNLVFQCGGLVQSALIGVLIDSFHSYSLIWIAFTVSCVLEILLVALFREKEA